MALQITDANFETEVLNSNQVVMIDFWAEWCGPCRAIAPIVEELAHQYENKAVIGKVDIDANPNTSLKYHVRTIPTVLFLKNGQVVDKQIGLVPKNVLEAKLKALL
jgi:thioredoxin 1